MRRARWVCYVMVGGAVVSAGVGCGTLRKNPKDTNVPLVEEFRPPPNEERFNNPPEMAYRKPPAKEEFKSSFGGGGGPAGGGLSGGQAGSGGLR